MKKAVVLHGTNADHTHNWFPWLKTELGGKSWQIWVPDLPDANQPNTNKYNEFIAQNVPWPLDSDTVFIGHSSGSVAILGLLNEFENDRKVGRCYLVGSFKDNLGRDDLKELFLKPFDFPKIKSKASKFIFIHSDNDPYCPLEHAKYLSQQLGGELRVLPGQGHFTASLDPEYTKFPEILDMIVKDEKGNGP